MIELVYNLYTSSIFLNTSMIKTEIIPVIHMIDEDQVLTNVKICIKNNIKKIFIINHQVSSEDLITCALKVKKIYPTLWVGINMLDKCIEDAIMYESELDAIWCDQSISPEYVYKHRKFKGMLFTGLLFKYQPQPTDIKLACENSVKSCDVSTTSGDGTGKEASISKILEIRNNLGNHPMAIASGVNSQNIKLYKNIVDYLLVASSITSKGEIIYDEKLAELQNLLNSNI